MIPASSALDQGRAAFSQLYKGDWVAHTKIDGYCRVVLRGTERECLDHIRAHSGKPYLYLAHRPLVCAVTTPRIPHPTCKPIRSCILPPDALVAVSVREAV